MPRMPTAVPLHTYLPPTTSRVHPTQVDAVSLNGSSSLDSLTLRYLDYPALAFPTIMFRNITLVTAASDPSAEPPITTSQPAGSPSGSNSTSDSSSSTGETGSGSSSAEQGATAWEPLWPGAADGWLLRLAAPPEAVLAEAAGAATADVEGAARAATAAGWSTLPLSHVPSMQASGVCYFLGGYLVLSHETRRSKHVVTRGVAVQSMRRWGPGPNCC